MNISAVVLSKNNEKNIVRCLRSLSFCDEILLIDDYSQDKTCEIAKGLGAKIYKYGLNSNFARQRNFGLEKALGKWVLFLDPDEEISEELKNEIVREISINDNPYNGFYLKRIDFIGKHVLRHGEIGKVRLLRLAKRKAGKWVRRVHEEWKIRGKKGVLITPIYHFHPNMAKYISNINLWSNFHAQANQNEGKRSNLFKIILWPIGKFFVSWILHLGFLDGMPGFVVALIMSFHSFLAWSKLWMMESNSK
jgi:glycosyltransferase involved in cell wall biosynthesis